jgi:hypothetical protein
MSNLKHLQGKNTKVKLMSRISEKIYVGSETGSGAKQPNTLTRQEYKGKIYVKDIGFFLFMYRYDIQHCFICRPSDSTVSEDAGIEPRTVATTAKQGPDPDPKPSKK